MPSPARHLDAHWRLYSGFSDPQRVQVFVFVQRREELNVVAAAGERYRPRCKDWADREKQRKQANEGPHQIKLEREPACRIGQEEHRRTSCSGGNFRKNTPFVAH